MIALHGPYVKPAWKAPLPNLAGAIAISAGYEAVIDPNGWSWKDVGQRAASSLIVESLFAALHHHHRR